MDWTDIGFAYLGGAVTAAVGIYGWALAWVYYDHKSGLVSGDRCLAILCALILGFIWPFGLIWAWLATDHARHGLMFHVPNPDPVTVVVPATQLMFAPLVNPQPIPAQNRQRGPSYFVSHAPSGSFGGQTTRPAPAHPNVRNTPARGSMSPSEFFSAITPEPQPRVALGDLDIETEPVKGWKIMGLVMEGGPPLLGGGYERWWATGKIAYCGDTPSDTCLLDERADWLNHGQGGAHCGIHILKKHPEGLIADANGYVIFAEVEGSGIVIEGTEGVYRASRVAMTRIHMICLHEPTSWDRAIAEHLWQRYQVPCEPVKREDWNDAIR